MRKPKRESQIVVRVSEQLKADLDRLAALKDVPMAFVIREALKQAVASGVSR
jgi:predicted transcriptional regulator